MGSEHQQKDRMCVDEQGERRKVSREVQGSCAGGRRPCSAGRGARQSTCIQTATATCSGGFILLTLSVFVKVPCRALEALVLHDQQFVHRLANFLE